jgi:hypothetical protein
MAKEQNLPLNPMKISGLCGRLMCCLKYEQEQYVTFRKEAPSRGTSISTPGGDGVVVGYNVPKDAITVKYEDGSFSDIRLSGCTCLEGGGLVVVPEEEPRSMSASEDVPELEGLSEDECTPEALTVVEAEVVASDDGDGVEVVVAETSRRSRGRRGRRGGRRRTKTQAASEAGERSPSGDKVATSGEGRSNPRRRGHKPPRHSHGQGQQQSTKQEGTSAESGEKNGAGQSTASTGGPSRRRRKRRPGGGESGDSAGSGAGGSDPG